MLRTSFNNGWEFRPKVDQFAEISGRSEPYRQVILPHDAMLAEQRTSEERAAGGYFPGGVYEYRKVFDAPAHDAGERVLVEFEAVYRDAMVYLNGAYVTQHPNGYTRFRADLTPHLIHGATNEIRVEARAHDDSRWYTGAGIYRDTWLLIGAPVRIAPDGLVVRTLEVDDGQAVVELAVRLESEERMLKTVEVGADLIDPTGDPIASRSTPVTVEPGADATARLRFMVPHPALWSPDTPALYEAVATVDHTEDTARTRFGIRTLRLDPDHGLRLNGESVKLRGACVHHDNGLLGAATFARAEERRVELLKAAGFNSIRMSHHPMSSAMLDACDSLGMLVVDEAFDMWTSTKSSFDYALSFPEWWERDLEAMVAKDINHPSVILYSIGNEIPETGSPAGAVWGRRLAEKVRSLDPSRYVTNGINTALAVMAELAAIRERQAAEESGSTGINTFMSDPAARLEALATSDLVTDRTAESFAVLDIAGMNYADARYELDRRLFPDRVILGTETFPTHIDRLWRLVEENPHVIGDFTWTGWDYLGEVGIGRPRYAGSGQADLVGPYPHLTADCGDIDITGHRRSASYFREIVFGLRTDPYLAVQRPEHHGKAAAGSPWAWSDAFASWTWPGHEDAPVTVEVYGGGDEVELYVNGLSRGRRPLIAFRAEFDVRYEPGDLLAITYAAGIEVGRHTLTTAGPPVQLVAVADRTAVTTGHGDLAFVTLTLTDGAGIVHSGADRRVALEISGDGVLAGFGSARPATEERFDDTAHHTYEGRALAILRPTGPGEIRLVAAAADCAPATLRIAVD